MKLSSVGGQTETTKAAAPSETASSASRPEFFRLPKKGVDPYFGFTRSFYYSGEQRGFWKLVRVRGRGKVRGVSLIPYDAIARFVKSQMEGAK